MPKIPTVGEYSAADIRTAVIETGGSVPTTEYSWDQLVAAAEWSRFDPAYLDGATSKAGITSAGQFRGYPRDMYGNDARSGSFQKQCSGDGVGSWHTYTVPANTYYSFVDKATANSLAEADVATNGQNYANTVSGGFCTWYSDEFTGTYYKEGCGYRGVGSSITHTIAAGAKSSTISKDNANDLAIAEMNSVGQSAANTMGYCTWYSEYRGDSIQRNDCGSGTGSYVWVEAGENEFSSTSSLADANAQRDAWMQGQANANGTCTSPLPTPNGSIFNASIISDPTHGTVARFFVGHTNKPSDPNVVLLYGYEITTGNSPVYIANASGSGWIGAEFWLKSGDKGYAWAQFYNTATSELSIQLYTVIDFDNA